MQPQSIIVNNFNISYLEVNPCRAAIIFFIHGNSNSNLLWQYQLADDRLSRYHLIAIDLPGHGNSSFGDNPAIDYSVQALGAIAYQTLLTLSTGKPFIICGFSLGSNIVAEMLAFNNKPKAIVMISPTIVGASIKPESLNDKAIVGDVLFSATVDDHQLDGYIDLAFSAASIQPKAIFKRDFIQTDKNFRNGLIESAAQGAFSDEIALIDESKAPCLIIIGENDQVVIPTVYDDLDLSSGRLEKVKIENGLHYLPLEMPEIINRFIGDFAEKVFTNSSDE